MNIKVTYLAHSGFLVELDTCYMLFDYYKGNLNNISKDKKLIVFVSHSHYDHFNKDIFHLDEEYPDIQYYISSDVKLSEKDIMEYGITGELSRKIEVVKAGQEYNLKIISENEIIIRTLKSTDKGVAYLVTYNGKTIYHAGDLHLWVWQEEDRQYNNNMTARFNKEMAVVKNYSIDVAFVPLDPRQEDWYHLGMDALLDITSIKHIFPMHFWDKPEIIQKYKEYRNKQYKGKSTDVNIVDVERTGQTWTIDI
ncbi:MAG: MBL fold metallo-hydrolase [Clostridiales bacterium]|nr:MBL fold metallo-hydrolase [Clostridiales bacterium]